MKQELQGKNVILYRRVSTTDQKENGNSLSTQKHSLRGFALENGMNVIREFEEDFSAKNFKRPEFNRLLDFVKINKRKVDFILITSWDRFSRNVYEALRVISEMRDLGVEINSVENWVDQDDPQQLLMQLLYLGMPEVDNRVKSQKVKDNMRQGLKDGRWNRSQPLGYIPGRDPENPNRPLMRKDPIKATLITELFKDYATGGYSQSEILKHPKYEHLKLSKSNLSRILKNELYTGKIRVPASKSEPEEMVNALHEPITDWETFQRVQHHLSQRTQNRHKPKKLNEHFPLRGHLECPKCSGSLTGSGSRSKTGKVHYYYHCNSSKGCKARFKVQEAHNKFECLLRQLKPDPGVSELLKIILEEKYKSSANMKYERINELKKEIDKLNERKGRLLDTLLDNVITQDTYRERESLIINEILNKKDSLLNLGDYQKDLKDYIDFGVFLLENLEDLYLQGDAVMKNKLLSSILDEKLLFLNSKYRTPKFKEGFAFIYQNINKLQRAKKENGDKLSNVSFMVPGAGIEPALPKKLDFESSASTSSATRAFLERGAKI